MTNKQDALKAVELKPCPFCGGDARLAHADAHSEVVYCTKCLAEGEHKALPEEAIKAWNTRQSEASRIARDFVQGGEG